MSQAVFLRPKADMHLTTYHDCLSRCPYIPTMPCRRRWVGTRAFLLQILLQDMLHCNIFVIIIFRCYKLIFQRFNLICNKYVTKLTYFYIKIVSFGDFRCNFEVSNKTKPLRRPKKRH